MKKLFLLAMLCLTAGLASAQTALTALPTPSLNATQTLALNNMKTGRGTNGVVQDVLTFNQSAIDGTSLSIRLEGAQVTFTGAKTVQAGLPNVEGWTGTTSSGTAGKAMLSRGAGGMYGTIFYGDRKYQVVQIGGYGSTAAATVLVKYPDGTPD